MRPSNEEKKNKKKFTVTTENVEHTDIVLIQLLILEEIESNIKFQLVSNLTITTEWE